jgi:hypothetical protein
MQATEGRNEKEVRDGTRRKGVGVGKSAVEGRRICEEENEYVMEGWENVTEMRASGQLEEETAA